MLKFFLCLVLCLLLSVHQKVNGQKSEKYPHLYYIDVTGYPTYWYYQQCDSKLTEKQKRKYILTIKCLDYDLIPAEFVVVRIFLPETEDTLVYLTDTSDIHAEIDITKNSYAIVTTSSPQYGRMEVEISLHDMKRIQSVTFIMGKRRYLARHTVHSKKPLSPMEIRKIIDNIYYGSEINGSDFRNRDVYYITIEI